MMQIYDVFFIQRKERHKRLLTGGYREAVWSQPTTIPASRQTKADADMTHVAIRKSRHSQHAV